MNFKAIVPWLAALLLQACIIGGGTGGEGLTGVIVDAAGDPVAGAAVGAYTLTDEPTTSVTDAEGRFRLSGLKAGRYNVAASAHRSDTTFAVFVPDIDVSSGDVEVGTRTLRLAGGLRLKVQASGGDPIAGARCAVPASPYVAVSDTGGTCLLDEMAPGTYRVGVSREAQDTSFTESVEVESGVTYGITTIVIMSGPDLGESWVVRESGTKADLHAVIWTGSRYVAVGDTGTVAFSADGATWTTTKVGDPRARLRDVAWTGTHLVAVGVGQLDSGVIFTSPTGENWTRRPSATWGLNAVTWTGARLVAVGDEGDIWTSPDGVSWDTTSSGTTKNLTDIAWNGEVLVAVGAGLVTGTAPGVLLSSPDGLAWTVRADSTPFASFTYVLWTGRHFYAGGGGLWISTNGTDWDDPFPGMGPFLSAAWTGDRLVSTGYYSANNSGAIWTHEDGGYGATTVNRYATGPYVYLNDIVARSYLQLVVVGDEGAILTSH